MDTGLRGYHLKYPGGGLNLSLWSFAQVANGRARETARLEVYLAGERERKGWAVVPARQAYTAVPCTHRKSRSGLCYRDEDLDEDGYVKQPIRRGRALKVGGRNRG